MFGRLGIPHHKSRRMCTAKAQDSCGNPSGVNTHVTQFTCVQLWIGVQLQLLILCKVGVDYHFYFLGGETESQKLNDLLWMWCPWVLFLFMNTFNSVWNYVWFSEMTKCHLDASEAN